MHHIDRQIATIDFLNLDLVRGELPTKHPHYRRFSAPRRAEQQQLNVAGLSPRRFQQAGCDAARFTD